MKKIAVLLVVAGSISVAQALAAGQYPAAFEATYEMTIPGVGLTTTHQMSDGKGHLRIESEAKGMKTVAIQDYPNMMMYSLMEAQKMYIKTPLKAENKITDEASAQKANAKSLGTKTIDGHPCHGWESKAGTSTTQSWIGDDIHNLVRSETTSPAGKVVMDLKSFSAKAPTGNLTAIPANFKEMKIPGAH